MTKTVKRIGCLIFAAIMTISTIIAIMPVKASAMDVIRYEIVYTNEKVKLYMTPQSEGNTIYYTINGDAPTQRSKKYTLPLATKNETTVRAAEFDKNGKKVATLKKTIMPKVPTPKITEERISGQVYIKISCSNAEAQIRYTTDGSTPNEASMLYSGAFVCSEGSTVKARAFKDGMKVSNIISHKIKKAGVEEEMLAAVNALRDKYGLSMLKLSDKLCEAANIRAKEIAELFEHTRPNGKNCFSVLDECGIKYFYAAENIAGGQPTVEKVMNELIASKPHLNNLKSKKANKLGVGCYKNGGMMYWVQLFTN